MIDNNERMVHDNKLVICIDHNNQLLHEILLNEVQT